MFRSLKNWLGRISGSAAPRSTTPTHRRARLGLEALEDRTLLTVTPLFSALSTTMAPKINQVTMIQPENTATWKSFTLNTATQQKSNYSYYANLIQDQDPVVVGPSPHVVMRDFTGVRFKLTTDNNPSNMHEFGITSQSTRSDMITYFNGTWKDLAGGGGGGPGSITGTLALDAQGNVSLVATWGGGMSATHVMRATISGIEGFYYLQGNVTPGPGNVHGSQETTLSTRSYEAPQPVAAVVNMEDLTNVSFTVATNDRGEMHQLVIQAQANQPNGSATFTGTWDPTNDHGAQAVTGTLNYDAQGNIHLAFNTSDGSTFDGFISGLATLYHFDGILTPGDGSSIVRLGGDQNPIGVAAVASVADLTNDNIAMTDDTGTADQLQIQVQVAQAEGTVTFTGTWEGQMSNDIFAYDTAGNFHSTFSGDRFSFEGTISGSVGPYHLDGNLTGADGASVQAAGDQTVGQATAVADLTNVGLTLTDDNPIVDHTV